jgi:RNA polymerase sigma-70 factor (ECF subfamily)
MEWSLSFEYSESLSEEEFGLEQDRELDAFLRSVEGRALRIAQIAVRDRDEALDIVQDAMIRLATRYANRPRAEWPPLFFRILSNRVRDWHRRSSVRNRVMLWVRGRDDDYDPVEQAPGPKADNPADRLEDDQAMAALEAALGDLPERQRQAFMLRNFEQLDVAATASAMGCSDGSVKTHYSRAVRRLRERLGEHWP